MSVNSKLTTLANSIRNKTGKTDALSLDAMASDLNAIADNDSSDLIVSGATISVPAGNYKVTASKSVATTVQATPIINVNTTTGEITANVTQTEGYVSAGMKSAEPINLNTKAATTITPTKSSQTAVAKNVYTTGIVTVAPIPDQYQDITTPLAELNAANGGAEANTIYDAVDNTEEYANNQEALIIQIANALEGKIAGSNILTKGV